MNCKGCGEPIPPGYKGNYCFVCLQDEHDGLADTELRDEYEDEILRKCYLAQLNAAVLGILTYTSINIDALRDKVHGYIWEVEKLLKEKR